MSNLNLTRRQKTELVFGYIRENSLHNIPVALVKLCVTYYEWVFYWSLYGRELARFLRTEHCDKIMSKMYYYNDVPCQLDLYPDGLFDESYRGDVAFFIRPIIPSHIEHIEASLRFIFNDKVLTTTHKVFSAEQKDWGWSDWVLTLDECRKHSKLCFGVDFNILCIKYKPSPTLATLYQPIGDIKIDKIFNQEWQIKADIIDTFKTYPPGKIYQSASFGHGNNWCLTCFPRNEEESLIFGVNLIQMPHQINKLRVKIALKENCKEIEDVAEITFDPRRDASSFYWKPSLFPSKWLDDVCLLHFDASITIISITDYDDVQIPQENWSSYGIV